MVLPIAERKCVAPACLSTRKRNDADKAEGKAPQETVNFFRRKALPREGARGRKDSELFPGVDYDVSGFSSA